MTSFAGNRAGPAFAGISPPLAWGAALFLSMLAHAMLLALLETATAPDPVPFTETVRQGIAVSALEVPSDRAAAAPVEGETAAASEAGGERLGVEAVPTSRATALAATSQALAPARPRGPVTGSVATAGPMTVAASVAGARLSAASPAGAATASAALPSEPAPTAAVPSQSTVAVAVASPVLGAQIPAADRVQATTATAAALVAGDAAPAPLPTLPPAGTPLSAVAAAAPVSRAATLPSAAVAAVPASAETLAADRPQESRLPATAGAGETLVETRTGGEAVAVAAPAALAATLEPAAPRSAAVTMDAALAWSGGAESVLDEKSLATIQSFMNPGAVSASRSFAGSPRDRIGETLAQVPCSRLQAAFQPETGGLEVRGHVPAEGLRGEVVALLTQTVGGAIPIGGSILVLPEPQCGLLAAVETLGFPQSKDQAGDPLVVGREAQAAILEMEDQELVTFQLQAPEFDAFIYLDYYDKDGQVVHVLPNEFDAANFWRADQPFKVGGTVEEGARFQMRIAPPFGQDIAVVLGASRELYEGIRPLVEDAAGYLAWLKARIETLKDEAPGFRGEWAYLFVKTGPQGAFR